MKSVLTAALAAASLLVPAAAEAVVLRYRLAPTDGRANAWRISFLLDSARTPSIVLNNNSVRFNGTPITYQAPNRLEVFTDSDPFDGVSFFTATPNQGGFAVNRFQRYERIGLAQARFFGPQLIDRTTATPGLRTGTFLLSDDPKNVPGDVQVFDYRLTVAAVPEPSSWAMMIGGFLLTGAALRRPARKPLAI